MLSTVVGSYPVHFNEKNTINKLSSTLGLYDPYKPAIFHAVESQLKAGIDIISDGQVRGDMVTIFAKNIPGFKSNGNSFEINSKIQKPNKHIGVNDLKIAINFMDDFLENSDLPEHEKEKKGVKGIVTGPYTLIQSSSLGNAYKNKDDAIMDLAIVLRDECLALEEVGAKLIQIDEPFFSTAKPKNKSQDSFFGVNKEHILKKAIDLITCDISIPVSIHCCGDISNIISELATFNVDIIDIEIAGFLSNIEVMENHLSELKGKKIGWGSIDTKNPLVGSIEDIAKIIEKGIDLFGLENLYIDPDCGMRLLNGDIAFSKLENMVKAMKSLE
ncbi:methionine synthase [Methanobrevibacter filiformis]|uniref:methionine synthase n=1 Tax=Methanobrevibacter filiformis TaxID=55758 RepID=UPI00082BDF05|nr:methionine synthase [Methanobrevibacter filiformis]